MQVAYVMQTSGIVQKGCLQTLMLDIFAMHSLCSIMSDETKEPSSANDLLKNSSLYREFQAEREEILKHKWIESEKAGHDIGFERALTDWIIKHRSKLAQNPPGRRHELTKTVPLTPPSEAAKEQ